MMTIFKVVTNRFYSVKMVEVQRKKEEEENTDNASGSSIAALTRQDNAG